MALDLNHPLRNGPRRVNGKLAARPLVEPELDEDVPRLFGLWMQTQEKEQALQAGLEAPVQIPEPTWPEFDSCKHGLLAPPRTRYIRLAKTDTEPPF